MRRAACTLPGCALFMLAAAVAPPIEAAEEPTGAVPRILIIGDSISLGYTPHVARMLKGKAVVTHNRGNAQHTGTGLKKLDAWLGKEKWDVIHFNWGLWDLCYRHPKSKVQGRRDKVNGKVTLTIEQYEKNLDRLVTRLKKTGAALIWASTTMVPENEAGRFVEDARKYNEAAAKVMKKHGVTTNDLYALTAAFPQSMFVRPGNVHYTKEGSARIARQVAEALMRAAAAPAGSQPETEGQRGRELRTGRDRPEAKKGVPRK